MSVEQHSQPQAKHLVVVGSSAGGIGALSIFVTTLRSDFPAPIVLAQHLDPRRPSNLCAVLAQRSSLPVVVVEDGAPLEPSKIYVVPSNQHVKIADGHILVAEDGAGPHPSVDLLLSSAAKAYGENLIAVVLTGAGSDGAAGAVDVKEAGGTVVIQNPDTAQYPSMPLSLPPTVVDHVAELEQIGPLLFQILQGVELPDMVLEKLDDPLRDLLIHVGRQTNIDFRAYKPTTILRRIGRRMAATHNANLREYKQYLELRPDEVHELVKAFLIKVTGFFRDPEAFEYLRAEVLPELIRQGRASGRVLRFWSAGCATGEEPYSLALMFADLLGDELAEWSIRIFATDLDEGAINYARRGLYPANILNELPDDYRDRFFEPVEHGYRIAKYLRQMVIFGQQDLNRGVPFPRIDLVVCRNLLIYLKPELQQHILDRFAYSLQQTRGFMFLGKAETARPTKATFELVNKRWKVYRCTDAGSNATGRELFSGPAPAVAERRKRAAQADAPAERHAARDAVAPLEIDLGQMRRLNEVLLRFLPFGVIMIDRQYRIVTINGTARRLLGIREIGSEQDFLHAVRGLPYASLRTAIDTVFRERTTRTLNDLELDPTTSGQARYLALSLLPMQQDGPTELAIITVSDVTEQNQTRRRLEAVQAEQTQLVEELSAANKRFTDVNKELQDSNEEFQAANEELMLTQEELQATNEEFEATNEELQATNEELETNNEELQATNEELQTTNDAHSARGDDRACARCDHRAARAGSTGRGVQSARR
jgi:two-component system CheB/CheR fusion protein